MTDLDRANQVRLSCSLNHCVYDIFNLWELILVVCDDGLESSCSGERVEGALSSGASPKFDISRQCKPMSINDTLMGVCLWCIMHVCVCI